jgi:hypothetical protein
MFLLLLSGGGIPFLFYRNPLSVLLLVGYVFLIAYYRRKVAKKWWVSSIAVLLFWLAVLGLNYLFAFGPQSIAKYGFYVLSLLTGLLVSVHYLRFKHLFTEDLYRALKWVMYHAILSFLAYFVIAGNLSELANDYYQCATFNKLFYYIPWRNNYTLPGGLLFCRNQGLFWEPGVLQIFLNILLFLELFVVRRSRKNMWLTILALLTTYSTTGLLLMALQLFVKFGSLLRRNVLLLPIVLGAGLLIFNFVGRNVEEKVSGDRESSAQIRMYDFLQPLLIVKDHPLTGIGVDSDNYMQVSSRYSLNVQAVDYSSLEKGNTNSVMYSLATLGIPLTILLFYALSKQPFIMEKRWLFFVLFFLSVFFEPVLMKQFFLFFVTAGGITLFNKIKISNG